MEKWLSTLLHPIAYPEPTQEVHLIQTHVSYIFMTDNHVYKVKKAVNFGFLDFSTVDKRRFFCEEEVRLNRRLCPEIYLGVEPVRAANSGAAFYGGGEILDYAVKMKRLPQERMLNRLLENNSVCEEDIRRIANTVARFHQHADRGESISRVGNFQSVTNNWNENFAQVQPYIGETLPQRDLEMIQGWVEKFLSTNAPFFISRSLEGFVRDCDGDIHAENICLLPDSVCIFDCIEFNSRFRFIDTASDIAFLLMDFDYHNHTRFGKVFLDEYSAASGDREATKVLLFYKAYRAFVRGKVESFRLNDPDMPDDERLLARTTARRYFRLARGYILREKLPRSLILFSGLMGSGKTTLAKELSFQLGVEVISSDVVRKEMLGLSPLTHVYGGYAEGIYSPTHSRSVYDQLANEAERALTEGTSIIVDASFTSKKERMKFRQLAEKSGARFHLIFATCGEAEIRQRLTDRGKTGKDASDGRWDIFHLQKKSFEQPTEDEQIIAVDTSAPPEAVVDRILAAIGVLPDVA